MPIEMGITLGALRSFKRLSYTPWHALAEFIDNSTQSYHTNKVELDGAYAPANEGLSVRIEYDVRHNGPLIVQDNAMGMSLVELQKAMMVGEPPEHPWRSRYGFGLKTAASWFGDEWIVETKRLGSDISYRVKVNVDDVAGGEKELPFDEWTEPVNVHYTKVSIPKLRHPLHSRTRLKVREFLRSMYREDLRDGLIRLSWLGEPLGWQDEDDFAHESGQLLRHDFEFEVAGEAITGWAGVLARGGRLKAGFSILHAGRVVRGTPDAWRPGAIYGEIQGANDLVNQRLVGEIDLTPFEVSHTKDFVSWEGDEEQEVELALKNAVQDLIDAAKRLRKPARRPGAATVKRAIVILQTELYSQPVGEAVLHPEPDTIERSASSSQAVVADVRRREPDFAVSYNGLSVAGYVVAREGSDADYLVVDATLPGLLTIVVNASHPHLVGIKTDGLLDHLQHCVYQALAECSRLRSPRARPACC